MSIECGYCGNKVHDADCPLVAGKKSYADEAQDMVLTKDVVNDELAVSRKYADSDPRSQGVPGSGEVVNHPSHYTFGKYEVVDVIYDWQPPYPLDNVIKYVARAGKKGGPEQELTDLKKAQFYLNYYISEKEKEK